MASHQGPSDSSGYKFSSEFGTSGVLTLLTSERRLNCYSGLFERMFFRPQSLAGMSPPWRPPGAPRVSLDCAGQTACRGAVVLLQRVTVPLATGSQDRTAGSPSW